ncbi:MAG: peptidase E [Flaviramulus sp.]|nr:peptidase E [Flaviramulus sp.]
MKLYKLLFLFLIIPFFSFTSLHKYYISVSQINYIEEKASLQITTRIFIDDFENLLRTRYDETITLAGKDEPEIANTYIEKYLKDKLTIKINNESVSVNFIGKEYDGDIVRCYLEVENVKNIKKIEISNQVLFDLFDEQQNIIKTKIYSKQKSVILSNQTNSMVLKFN